ncbi:unnamed protein product, partial [Didymodactylos carnosus]
LRRLRQSNDIEQELIEIQTEENTQSTKNLNLIELLRHSRFKWPIITSLVLNAIQQLSGINAVFFYSGDMFSAAGLKEEKIFYGILATGVINLLATLLSLRLIELLGRRPLIIWPMTLIVLLMVVLCVLVEVNRRKSQEGIAIGALILILIFIILFAIGLGPIPTVYSNEVFAIEAKSAGLSSAMFINWFCNFLVALLFLPLQMIMNGYVFLLFFACVAAAFGLLFFKMPETKNKKLLEIESFWK